MTVLTLDLSSTCIGWAIGTYSDNLKLTDVEFGEERRPSSRNTEEKKLEWAHRVCMALVKSSGSKDVVIEESNVFLNAKTTRLLLGIRGVVLLGMFKAKARITLLSASPSRRKVGIDTGIPKSFGGKAKRRSEIKKRVIKWCHDKKHKVKTDDAGDAVVLLYAHEVK